MQAEKCEVWEEVLMGTESCKGQKGFISSRRHLTWFQKPQASKSRHTLVSLIHHINRNPVFVFVVSWLAVSGFCVYLFLYKRSVRVYGELTGNQWFLCLCVGVQLSIHVCLCGCTAWKYTHAYTYAQTQRVGQEEAGCELFSFTSYFRLE